MRERPIRALWLLTAAAVGLTTMGPVAPASAAAAEPQFTRIESAPGRPEILRATVASDSPLTSVVVEAGASGSWTMTKVGDSDVWESEPLVFSTLGAKDLEVRATDQDGDKAYRYTRIDYLLVPHLGTHAVGTDPLTFENPTVTATGRFTAYDPRSRSMTDTPPLGHVALRFTSPSLGGWWPTYEQLNADGSYSITGAPTRFTSGEDVTVTVAFSGDGYTTGTDVIGGTGESATDGEVLDSVEVLATSCPSRVILDATKLTVKQPAKAIVKGVVERQVGGVWEPVAGVHVVVDSTGVPYVTTGSDGRLTAYVGLGDDYVVAARINEPVRGLYLQATDDHPVEDRVAVHVIRRTTLQWDSRLLEANWSIWLEGRVNVQYGDVGRVRVYLQDSKNGKTGWYNVTSILSYSEGSFSGTRSVDYPSRYHRLVFYGNANLQPSVTKAYRLSRHEARIVKAKASPATVTKGKKITVRGVVQRETGGSFVHLGKGKYVDVFFRAKSSKKYVWKGYTRTTSIGSFAKSFKATKDGYWLSVWFTTNSKIVNAYSVEKYVNVTGTSASALADVTPVLPDVEPEGYSPRRGAPSRAPARAR